MLKSKDQKIPHNDYKIIVSELGTNPLRKIKTAFALMSVIPFLIFLYIIIGKNFLYNLVLGSNGFILAVSIFIGIGGFMISYHLVASMVKRLLLSLAELRRDDEEKGELILAVTHDLKTPLAVIKTGLQNMLDGIAGAVTNAQSEIVNICIRALNKTNDFINELLDLSKIKHARMNFKREFINFDDLVKAEIRAISELAKKNKQNIAYSVLTNDPNLWGDKDKLSRAVMNLLSNAVKYSPTGGDINVSVSGDEDTVRFSVVNRGIGIPTDKLDKIFNKYERLHADTQISGTGLGLYIVKDIIELHKGHLIAKSEPQKETEFSIVLPKDLRSKKR